MTSSALYKKRQEIEWLRILSAFGIVWFHSAHIGRNIGYAGLIAFLIISLYLAAKPKSILERAKRLLIPWGFWLFFYGLLNLVRKEPLLITDNDIISAMLVGTGYHLWYMPFIFLMIIFFDQVRNYLSEKTLSYLSVSLIVLLIVSASYWRTWSLEPPLAQYMHAFVGVLIGVFFSSYRSIPRTTFFILLLLIFILLGIFALNIEGFGLPYVIGIAVTSFVLIPRWNFLPNINLNWLADCTLGIYMLHPFFILLVTKFHIVPPFFLAFVVFTLSAITVWFFKKTFPRITSYIV